MATKKKSDEKTTEKPSALRGQVNVWFTYHPPNPDQIPKYTALRTRGHAIGVAIAEIADANIAGDDAALKGAKRRFGDTISEMQKAIHELTPPGCVERKHAISALTACGHRGNGDEVDLALASAREVVMWANAAVACN